MAQFVLENELDELAYDFSPRGKPGVGPAGVIPEPSAKQLAKFSKEIRLVWGESLAAVEASKDLSVAERIAKLKEALSEEDADSRDQEMVNAVAAVCSGKPSAEEISALSARAQQTFVGWIVGVLLNPETPTPATKQ